MKSTGEKVALIIAIILIIIFITGAVCALVFGIKFFKEHVMIIKDSITAEKFVSIMKDEGFETKEITGYANNNQSKKAYKAENGKYIVEFYEFEKEEDAIVFASNQEQAKDSNVNTKKISVSGKNYSTFTVVRSGEYAFVERIDKTVVVVYGSSKQEDASKELLKKFGY
jgi:hypothetical protein